MATQPELDRIMTHADLDNLAPDCFVYCLARIDRDAAQLQQLFVVLEPMEDEEAFAMAAWFDADSRLLAAQVQESAMIKAQADYVVWRDSVLAREGKTRDSIAVLKSTLPASDPDDFVAHRWRKRFCAKVEAVPQ